MTDDELLASARALVAKWQPRMHLGAYLVKVVLDQESDAPARYTVPAYEQHVLITLRPSVCADLRTTYPELADLTDEQVVELAVVHELSHVLVVAEWQEMNRHLEWLIGKREQAGFFSDAHSAWLDLDEAIARRTSRILLEADRGAWTTVTTKDGALD